jgi:hypothetical protein
MRDHTRHGKASTAGMPGRNGRGEPPATETFAGIPVSLAPRRETLRPGRSPAARAPDPPPFPRAGAPSGSPPPNPPPVPDETGRSAGRPASGRNSASGTSGTTYVPDPVLPRT